MIAWYAALPVTMPVVTRHKGTSKASNRRCLPSVAIVCFDNIKYLKDECIDSVKVSCISMQTLLILQHGTNVLNSCLDNKKWMVTIRFNKTY